MIRRLAAGRNNRLFVASQAGGKRMAIIYSIIATGEILGIDPEEYLEDVLLCTAIRAPDTVCQRHYANRMGQIKESWLPKVTPMYPSLGRQ